MSTGTPNRHIQFDINACAHADADMSDNGMASGHLVNLSTMVKMYENPLDGGRGPTMSILM